MQCSFLLAPVDGAALPPFRPGQFLTFNLAVATSIELSTPDGAIVRCYSLSDAPNPTHYRITVRKITAPDAAPAAPAGVSSTYFHDRVKVGDIVDIKPPAGHFYLDPDPSVPVVLVAGGIGLTPLLSMVAWCCRTQPQRSVHLYYGVRNGDDHAFRETLEQACQTLANFKLCVAYSRPQGGDALGIDYHHWGHVDVDLIRATLPHGRHQFYICGPTSMMNELVPALLAWGVPENDVHFEAFGPATVRLPTGHVQSAADAASGGMQIHFQRSGRTLTWENRNESLLEFGERHGVFMASGCRSGCCGTCESPLLAGQVSYPTEPDHDVAKGHCLPCVARPRSAITIEA
jgi:ferredoxin-NADP reductase